MIRRFCDVCGREIREKEDVHTIRVGKITPAYNPSTPLQTLATTTEDLIDACDECALKYDGDLRRFLTDWYSIQLNSRIIPKGLRK